MRQLVSYRIMASWKYLKDGAGILPASDMADPLRGTNLTETEVLVREAVQNSLDERRPDVDRPVRIRFDRRVLTGDEKMRFVTNLNMSELSERRKHFRLSHNWFARGNEVLDAIDNPSVGLPILSISDFNTTGLGGRWNRRGSPNDRFFNLVLSIGGSLKWDEQEATDARRSLGSYGFGKMAFAMCSDIRTVIYYSTFTPDEHSAEARCRAMASGFLPPHSVEDIDYAGQAYFGIDSGEERIPRKPLTNNEAHEWICALGLPSRRNEDTGTTVVIPAVGSTTMRQIMENCERWWWPRMRDPNPLQCVQFEFLDAGSRIAGCNPRSRPQLSPFIDCYKLSKAERSGNGYEIHDVKVRPEGKHRTAGRLILKASKLPNDVDDDDNVDAQSLVNHVAFVREGLVVKYENGFAHEDKPPVVGVFIPDVETQTLQAFVFSEPPTHDDWIENADRLRDKYPWGSEFLRLTKKRLHGLTRDFQTRQTPLPPDGLTNAAAFLRKTLGDLFRTSTRRTSPPAPAPVQRRRAFTISTRESGRRVTATRPEDFALFRIGLSEHAPVESALATVTVSLRALADADATPADHIPCEVAEPNGLHRGQERAVFTVKLHRDCEIEIKASALVHECWKTQWEISVDKNDA